MDIWGCAIWVALISFVIIQVVNFCVGHMLGKKIHQLQSRAELHAVRGAAARGDIRLVSHGDSTLLARFDQQCKWIVANDLRGLYGSDNIVVDLNTVGDEDAHGQSAERRVYGWPNHLMMTAPEITTSVVCDTLIGTTRVVKTYGGKGEVTVYEPCKWCGTQIKEGFNQGYCTTCWTARRWTARWGDLPDPTDYANATPPEPVIADARRARAVSAVIGQSVKVDGRSCRIAGDGDLPDGVVLRSRRARTSIVTRRDDPLYGRCECGGILMGWGSGLCRSCTERLARPFEEHREMVEQLQKTLKRLDLLS